MRQGEAVPRLTDLPPLVWVGGWKSPSISDPYLCLLKADGSLHFVLDRLLLSDLLGSRLLLDFIQHRFGPVEGGESTLRRGSRPRCRGRPARRGRCVDVPWSVCLRCHDSICRVCCYAPRRLPPARPSSVPPPGTRLVQAAMVAGHILQVVEAEARGEDGDLHLLLQGVVDGNTPTSTRSWIRSDS